MSGVAVVIPAYNEEARLEATLRAFHRMKRDGNGWDELIVVDDGSTDRTAKLASSWATTVVVHERRRGKGAAMKSGWLHSAADIVLFADADLEGSAVHLSRLIAPLRAGQADMAIAAFAAPASNGGFGIVKRLAQLGIYRLTGLRMAAPLSGQRAVRRTLLNELRRWPTGFGIEVGLTLDAARLGYRLCEVSLPLRHRETGKTWAGFAHRGRQLLAVGTTLLGHWERPAR